MLPWLLPLVVGLSCALCAGIPAWLWARAENRAERLRHELAQAHKTIRNLNTLLGNNKTQYIPLSVSQRWMKGE